MGLIKTRIKALMNSQTKTSIRLQVILTLLAIALLAGCGRKENVDYTIEGMTQEEQPQDEGGWSSLEQLVTEETWEETWIAEMGETFEYEGQTYTIKQKLNINAKIEIPQTQTMSVVEVMEPEFDEEYKKNIAECLFDSGEIYYGDPSHLPKRDLQDIQRLIEEVYAIRKGIDYHKKETDEIVARLYDAVDNMENAKDTYTLVEEYTGSAYIGLYEGRLYNLDFLEDDGMNSSYKCSAKRILWTVRDLQAVCPERFKDQEQPQCSPWMKGNWIENHCRISQEDALKEARQLVDRLGLDYSVVSFTCPLAWGNVPLLVGTSDWTEADDWEVNGYVFSFDLGMDDISFVDYGIQQDYWDFGQYTKSGEEMQYSLNARLQVYVTDQGIIKMVADNPLEIMGVKEGVELLSLDTVKEIIKEKIAGQRDVLRFDFYGMDFNDMELIYFRIRDKENPGKFSYVPTWRLAVVSKYELLHMIDIRNPVLINAIDGSLIDFFDET